MSSKRSATKEHCGKALHRYTQTCSFRHRPYQFPSTQSTKVSWHTYIPYYLPLITFNCCWISFDGLSLMVLHNPYIVRTYRWKQRIAIKHALLLVQRDAAVYHEIIKATLTNVAFHAKHSLNSHCHITWKMFSWTH